MVDMGYNSAMRVKDLIKIKPEDADWEEKYLKREGLYAVRPDGEGIDKEYLILLENESDFEYAKQNYRHSHWYKEVKISYVPRINKYEKDNEEK